MPLKFAANLSTMFQEYPLMERFDKAMGSGFTHFEIQSPYEVSPSKIAEKMSGLKCVMINSYGGEQCGFASVPMKEIEFCNSFSKSLEYHRNMGFKKLHILAGLKSPSFTEDQQFTKFVETLNGCAESLENNGIMGLIEPICPDVIPDYFLSTFDMAVRAIEALEHKEIKLLLDVYHLQKISGDAKANFEKYFPYAGHIQISQDPGRKEPFACNGKIDYKYIFKFLEEHNYQDHIGLEYYPSGRTQESLDWMQQYI